MATPVKSTIGDRRSAFDSASEAVEGSPVFNYISNLSPIKPVKSVHLSHSLQELQYGSPVFASPKINSANQATGLTREPFACSSEVKFSSDAEERKPSAPSNTDCPHSTEIAAKVKCEKEDSDSRNSVSCSAHGESIHDHNSNGDTNFSIKQPNAVMESYQILRYVDNGPIDSVTPSYNIKTETGVAIPSILPSSDIQMTGIPSTVVQLVDLFNNCGVESERHAVPDVQTYTDNNSRKSIMAIHSRRDDVDPRYELPDMVADALDEFFIFSPTAQTDAQLEKFDHTSTQNANFASSFVPKHSQITANGWTSTQDCDSSHSSYIACEQEHANGSKEAHGQEDVGLTPQMTSATIPKTVVKGDNIEKTDDRTVYPDAHWIPLNCKISNQQLRGVRRRCLTFEATEGQKNNVEDDSLFNAPDTSYAERLSPDDQQLIACDLKRSSNRSLSGIGLHLNSLATPSLSCRAAKIEAIISGNQIEKKSISFSVVNSAYENQKVIENSVDLKSAAGGSDISGVKPPYENEIVSSVELRDDMIEQSPKRKRRKETRSGENAGCKRCHCKKSKCLKLYCECFAAGVYCVNVCSCQGCQNKPEHEDIVIEIRGRIENRNPFAFAPKIMKPPEPVLENKEAGTQVSILPRHKTGCNCKKSKCTKKYCECFQGGVACSGGCRCEGCTNTFGKKEGVYGDLLRENSGSSPDQNIEDLSKRSREIENRDSETREAAEPVPDPHPEIQDIQNDAQQSSQCSSSTPAFEICGSAILPPPSSPSKPPRRSRSGCRAKKAKTDTGFFFSRFQPEKHFMQTVVEDGVPEFLRAVETPNKGLMVASPKRKRVSPPHVDAGAKSLDSGSHRRLLLHPISSLQQVGVAPSEDGFQAKFS